MEKRYLALWKWLCEGKLKVKTNKGGKFLKKLVLRRWDSDEGLTLETSAFESLYGGQFTLSSQLIKQN